MIADLPTRAAIASAIPLCAPAKIAAHPLAEFVMVEPNRLGRQVSCDSARDSSLYLVGHADRGTELARRAITALKTIVLYERLLQWMQMVSLGEALNRNDRPILILYRQRETGVDPLTVAVQAPQAP